MITFKKYVALAVAACMAFTVLISGCAGTGAGKTKEAVYLGVKDYGQEEVNKNNKESFLYRFEIDGKECTYRMDNGAVNKDGEYEYPIQNILKEGYSYVVSINNDTITSAQETGSLEADYVPVVSGTPGERTLANFLRTAMMPVGTTLYIYGGGWDWQDSGSAIQARTIGISPDWVKFFDEHDVDYTYNSKDGNEDNSDPTSSYYPYGGYNEYYYAGLDCSGYLGWILYNTFETESGRDGYVGGSTGFAKRLSEMGFGEWTQDVKAPDGKNGYEMKPGDVMSINGHVWISLGTCDDGSVVILHSTPANSRTGQPGGGVEISAVGTTEDCKAYILADRYMSQYYPKWYERYPVKLADPDVYFTFEGENAGRFTWDTENAADGLRDPEKIKAKPVEDVLELLFADCGSHNGNSGTNKSAANTFKENATISYLGPEGTYTEEAARYFFNSTGSFQPKETVDAAIEDAASGASDYAVIPQENTIGGAVTNYVDALLGRNGVYVVGEVIIPISQTLMGIPGTTINDIKTVYSHAQEIKQSEQWRKEHIPDAEALEMGSTAAAAAYVAEQNDKTLAAVAAPGAAELYGLEVLAENVQITDTNAKTGSCRACGATAVSGRSPGGQYSPSASGQ